ncbi:hypothetical protein H6G91_24140 [Nostoc muscorum FACHB-395]|nr:hypothetical protein [Desmonostoc muscorum FACHB-395]
MESRIIPIDDMKRLIKKTSNPVRKKIEVTPPPIEPIEIPESQNIPETVIEPNPPVYIEELKTTFPNPNTFLNTIAPSALWVTPGGNRLMFGAS